MIEQYLQFATKFIKEKWLQLNAMFQLEETQTFKFLKPYLLQAQDNPAYIGIAIALMAILYSLYKFISISRKRKNKLNERENKISELENKLNDRENKLSELENKLNERENKISELENKLNDRENKLNEFRKKFNELMDEMEDEEEEIDINNPRVIGKEDHDQAIAYFKKGNGKEAVAFFRKAAEQGDAEAQNSLGVMYAKGEEVVQSDTEAAKWYKKAAEQGLATAQFNLGVMYQKGEGVFQSDTEAIKWHKKAAEQGNAEAQKNFDVLSDLLEKEAKAKVKVKAKEYNDIEKFTVE